MAYQVRRHFRSPPFHEPMTAQSEKLSQEVKETMLDLRRLFYRLSMGTLKKIPRDMETAVEFGREIASMIFTLSMLNEALVRRLFSGQPLPGGAEPPWLKETLDWVSLPDRQPRSRVAEQRMRDLLARLNQLIGYLDEESFRNLPPRQKEIPQFLSLSLMLQSHLAWYLDVAWFPRTFSLDPPAG